MKAYKVININEPSCLGYVFANTVFEAVYIWNENSDYQLSEFSHIELYEMSKYDFMTEMLLYPNIDYGAANVVMVINFDSDNRFNEKMSFEGAVSKDTPYVVSRLFCKK